MPGMSLGVSSQLPVPSTSNSAPLDSLSGPSIPMSELQCLFDLPGPDPLPPPSSASPPLGGPNRSSIPMTELLRRLHDPVNSDSGVLNVHQGPRSLPDPHSLVESTGSASSLSLVTRTGMPNPSSFTSMSEAGAIRTSGKRTCHTAVELRASPSYCSQNSTKPDLTRQEMETVEETKQLYLRNICVVSPWPERIEKSKIMWECLSLANVQAKTSVSKGSEIDPLKSKWVLSKVSRC